MRQLTDHKFTPANDGITIEVVDKPGHGCANHHYSIYGFDTENNESNVGTGGFRSLYTRLPIIFQNGTVPEVGINGVTEQALLAIIMDRLRSFQSGPFSCRENALALTKLEEAMHWMHARTNNRVKRGVEGKLRA